MKTLAEQIDWQKCDGLVPAVVCHSVTGKVLMVAWCNREALDKTIDSRLVTFFSRSRQTLWTKGETSGHTLSLVAIRSDCDNDTVLIEALPAGPTCHTGSVSCFDSKTPVTGMGFLGELEAIVHNRKKLLAAGIAGTSYTADLLRQGPAKIAQKVGEEGVEVALAGVQGIAEDITNESADLLFHLIVLLSDQDIALETVLQTLRDRHIKQSGKA